MNSHNQYDIIILGAGPVGTVLALLLAKYFRIALVDANLLPPAASGHRVSAVNKQSCDILDKVGCVLSKKEATPFVDMEVFEQHSDRLVHFTAKEVHAPYLGKIIVNHALTQQLQYLAKNNNKIDFLCPLQAKNIMVEETGISLITADNRSIFSALLIGADGAQSWMREYLGFTFDSEDYHEQALVAQVTTALPHHNTAGQYFLPTGPVAFLPLSEPCQVSLVWSGSSGLITRLMNLDETAFCEELTQAWENRLGKVMQAQHRARFELTMRHTHEYVRQRVALVGDALHTIHPLAGQGLNLGIADASRLAQILIDAAEAQQDIGTLSVLRRFSRERRAPNTMMIALMKGFQQGFKLNAMPLVKMRRQLLKTFDHLPLVKRIILKEQL